MTGLEVYQISKVYYLPEAEMNSYGLCCMVYGDGTFWKYDMYLNFNILAKITKLLSLVTAIVYKHFIMDFLR